MTFFGSFQSKGISRSSRLRLSPVPCTLVSLAITIILGAAYFYVELPAINIHSYGFYWFLFILGAIFTVSMLLLSDTDANAQKASKKTLRILLIYTGIILAIVILGSVCGMVIFRSDDYASLLQVKDGNFAEEVDEISFGHIPMLDKDSANNLANRKLGELSDLVSQFEVDPASAQINYRDTAVRVAHLDYGSFFKWIANRSQGIPAYMIIDMATQEVNVVRLEEGIKYSPSEYFSRDLDRYLRFKYPTKIFSDVNFEINEDGTPYWVASVIEKRIGLFNGEDAVGAVLLNAITGEAEYLDNADIPTWVDRVHPSDIIISQYDYYGKYREGFWNSMFGQKNCTATTGGYNYIALDDDVWVYTGITSVTGDRGNIGFILVNQRTKEAKFYSCAGAEEYSAMSSAEGAVQQYSYTSTFPLLLNISDQPTYFMALKDDAGLVKMYAMVNVQQYQIVATGSSVENCLENYVEAMKTNDIVTDEKPDEAEMPLETITGTITDLRSAVIDGNTYMFISLDEGEVYYKVSVKEYPKALILNKGDSTTIEFYASEEIIIDSRLKG